MYQRILIFPLAMRDVYAFPLLDVLHILHQPAATAPQGNELDAIFIELGEIGIGGKARIEDQCGFHSSPHLGPIVHERQDLIIGLCALDICLGVEQQLGLRILSKQRQGPLHHLAAGTGPVAVEHGLVTEVWNPH